MAADPNDYSSWTWELIIQYILAMGGVQANGGGDVFKRETIAGPSIPWLKLKSVETWDIDAEDVEDWQPPDPGTDEWIFYRWTRIGQDVAGHVRDGGTVQVVTGTYEFRNANNGAKQSPSSNLYNFLTAGQTAAASFGAQNNPTFNSTSFSNAAVLLSDFAAWLANTGEPGLKRITDQLGDDASPFKGTAAEVFYNEVHNLFETVYLLQANITSPNDWSKQLSDGAFNVGWFSQSAANEWLRYMTDGGYPTSTYHPENLLGNVFWRLAENAAGWTVPGGSPYAVPDPSHWVVNVPLQDQSVSADILTADGWNNLSTLAENVWLERLLVLDHNLDSNYLLPLVNSFEQSTDIFSIGLSNLPDTGTGGPDANPNPNIGGPPDGGAGGPNGLNGGGAGGPDAGAGGPGAGAGGLDGGGSGGAGGPNASGGSSAGNPNVDLGGGPGGGGGPGAVGGGVGGGGAGGNLPGLGSDLGSGGGPLGGGAIGGGGALGGDGGVVPGILGPIGGVGGLPGNGKAGTGLSTDRAGVLAPGAGLPGAKDGSGVPSSQFPTPIDTTRVGGPTGNPIGAIGVGGGAAAGPTAGVGGPLAGAQANAGPPPFATGYAGPGSPGAGLDGLSGSTGASAAEGALASSAAGTGGAGGYPFFPPMGGGMGGMGAAGQSREGERNTWLAEDEEVWGTEPDCAPAVIGRGDIPDSAGGPSSAREYDGSRRPAPQRPATGSDNRARRRGR